MPNQKPKLIQVFDNMFFVYAIKSEKDGRIYVGMCNEVEVRLKQHNAGKTK